IAVVPNSYRRTSLSPATVNQNKSINNDENASTTATGRKYLLAIEDGRRLSSSFTDVAPSATSGSGDGFFNSPIYTRTEWRTNHMINDTDQNDSDEQDSSSHRSLKSLSKELAGVLLNTGGGGTAGEGRSSSYRRSMRVKTVPSHRSGIGGSGSSHSLSSEAFVGQSLAARRQAYFTLLEQSRNASKERFGKGGTGTRQSTNEMGVAEAALQHRQSMPGYAHDRSGSMGGPDHKEYEARKGRSKNYMISDEIEALLEIPMSRRCLIPAPVAAAALRSVSPHSRQPILAHRSIAGSGNGSSSNHSSLGSITLEKSIHTELDQQQQKVTDETPIKTTDIPRVDGGNLELPPMIGPYEASRLSVLSFSPNPLRTIPNCSSFSGEIVSLLQLNDKQKYLPIFTVEELHYRMRDLEKIGTSSNKMNITIRYQSTSIGKLRLLYTAKQSTESLRSLGFTDKDIDEVKGIFTDTNFYFLALTFFVAAVHLLLDFLAFKNDISFWRNRKTMVGISTKTLIWRFFSQAIVFFYLLDENTSLLILIPTGLGVLIELWKLSKAFKVTIDFRGKFGSPRLRFGLVSKQEQETADFDAQGMHYLVYILTPLCISGAVYSLLYVPHKSWYSWFVQSLANAVYAFGFLFMLPQLFINYKLKSVAHLPWRAFMYKAFNTFIDDMFAFIISMPTAHRVACFRDDVVFVVYLYQRYLYPVDKSRVNEFGECFDKEENKKTK
uniref:Lipid scramblase CLPTM1L n=1 Tax=Romanomermis culicivorax TaxID=13658 RepID=A0A915I7N0_ROMCU